ncbi:MAG: hypothetical protein RLZZ143_1040 [Cyanobacteriota bacterium]|jgi:hypothetical protein
MYRGEGSEVITQIVISESLLFHSKTYGFKRAKTERFTYYTY